MFMITDGRLGNFNFVKDNDDFVDPDWVYQVIDVIVGHGSE